MSSKYIKTGRITNSEMTKIEKEKASYYSKVHNSQITNRKNSGYVDETIRKSLVYFPDIKECKRTLNILQGIIIQELSNYNIDVSQISEVQYVRYELGGKFDWHHDIIPTERADSKSRGITFSINITDPSEYEGGELKIKHNKTIIELSKEKGSYIMFPSYMKHQVFEVTRGIREAIILWVYLTSKEIDMLRNETN